MAKTNYTKVEDALRDGLDMMLKSKLLEEADLAQGKLPSKQHALDELVAKIRHEFKFLKKHDKGIFEKVGVDEKIVKELLSSSKSLSLDDWKTLKEILKKIEIYRDELEKTLPKLKDDEIIDQEKRKHINKRFNIRDDWLPLK